MTSANRVHPHTLGIEANEAFFLEDSIILVEGQEDVVIFNKMARDLSMDLKGNFFGWGVGGAPKMKRLDNAHHLAALLRHPNTLQY